MKKIKRTPETIELNARLQIVRLDDLEFHTPKGRATVTGYGFHIAGLGYVRFKSDTDGLPYAPCGGKHALQQIIDDGGFIDYNDITFVNADNEPEPDNTNYFAQWAFMKTKHPDALIMFRNGDFYESYFDDANDIAKILDDTIMFANRDGKFFAMYRFNHYDLDSVLPKVIRAGKRVAICDPIERPRKSIKRQPYNSESR